MSRAELISESIDPVGGALDTAAMGRGEPGVPRAFQWRGVVRTIAKTRAVWKHASREGAQAQGELYLRRHYYRFEMDDGSEWVVYFLRQTPPSGSAKKRWFLYTRDGSARRGMEGSGGS
ncbi:MAG: DUF6504 family protein [Phycisphaerae bacterium]